MKRETYETMFIPDELDGAIKEGIENGKKERKKRKRKTIITIGGSIAAVFALFITVCVANPTLASKIPFIDKIFEKVQDNAVFKGDYSEHATHLADTLPEDVPNENPKDSEASNPLDSQVNSSDSSFDAESKDTFEQLEELYGDTDQNITVTPEEVYCDGVSLYLGLRFTIVDEDGWGFESADDLGLRQGFQLIGNCEVDGNHASFSNFVTIGMPEKSDVLVGMIKLPADGISESEETLKVNIETICWNNFNKYYEVLGTPEEEKRPWYHVLAGDWNLTVPVTIDTSQTKVYQINESNAEGYGIATVNVTPYEIQVLPIKPEEDTKLFLGAFAVFNEKGECFDWGESSSSFDCYIVDGKTAEQLYFYYFRDEIEAFKCKDQTVAEENCIYKYKLDLY